MDIDKLLRFMVEKGASDAFITAGVAPSLKINGKVMPVTDQLLSGDQTRKIITGVMTAKQRAEFEQDHECNFAVARAGIGRFRASAYVQRNMCGMVLRRIETIIPTMEELNLPPILRELALTKRGLVIFVGATGSGKSTSLAAMIGFRNKKTTGHIISIEDPIEFIHEHRGCIISQREVGIDTESFEVALKNTLRQAPDVIMIGEVRTRETMEQAITFAETGHLCLCTLHANNANQALDRILHFFAPERHNQIWMDLSMNLRGMVAQQLIPTPNGKARRAAVEILLNTPLASDLIRKGEVHKLKELMSRSNEQGMQTFDQALFRLFKDGEIDEESALASADSRNDLRLMIKLDAEGGDASAYDTDTSMTLDGPAGAGPNEPGHMWKTSVTGRTVE
jgi:twitching motility protein PilU